jgi:dTMP kinase
MHGKFIVIDGGDGTGTSSVTQYLVEVLGNTAIQTREPGGSPFAEKVRELILDPAAKNIDAGTMLALFCAARWDHVLNTVEPALKKRLHVLCDRFDSSTYAYQIYAEKHPEFMPLFQAYRSALKKTHCLPDHYIILDGDPRICLPRAKRRAQKTGKKLNHFDERKFAYHNAVRKGLLRFVKGKPHTIIDAEQPEDVVRKEVLAVVKEIIGGS